MVGTATEVGPGQAPPPRRVVLLSEGGGLAVLLSHLLDGVGRLHRFSSLRQALEHDGLLDADTVVLDLPGEGADTAVAHVRHHWKGALVVLAKRGHRPAAPQPAWTLLTRPFSAQQLAAALGLPTVAEPRQPPEPAHPRPTATQPAPAWSGPAQGRLALGAALGWATSWARAASDRVAATEPATRTLDALAGFAEAWRSRRRVRVAGISLFALVAFTVAFAFAARDRCGPSCDAFGTAFSPASTVVAPSASSASWTTGREHASTTTVVTAGPAGTGSFQGTYGGRLASTTTARKTTTTDERAASPTTRPATTRPATTQSTAPPTTPPPTTAPPTTAPPTTVGG